jgi:hypothetical protein
MSLRDIWKLWFVHRPIVHAAPAQAKKDLPRPHMVLTLKPKELRFIGEQDGPVERELKKNLVPLLASHPEVLRAYLARVGFGEESQEKSVAVCLRSDKKDEQLVREIMAVFFRMFAKPMHLDVIFISDRQESRLAPLCVPFFGGSP